jgi:hypothetical protein
VYELLDRKVFDLFKEIGLALLKDGDESGIRRRIDLRNSIDASQIDVDLLCDEVVLWHSALTFEVQPRLSPAPAPPLAGCAAGRRSVFLHSAALLCAALRR